MGKKVKKLGKSVTKVVKKPFKEAKRAASSVAGEVKRVGSSVNKEIRRGAKSIGDEVMRHPEDYLTMGMTAGVREGAKGVGQLLAPDINIDTGDDEAARLMREQQTRAENANADLSLENIANVVGGGTAASLGGVGRRRKKAGRGPATSLGINA